MRCTVLCVLELQNNLGGSCFEVVTGFSASDIAASYRPCRARPWLAMPYPASPQVLSHRNDHSMNGHYADQQPLPRSTRSRQASPRTASWYSVPESTLCEGADRYVVALATPRRALPGRASPNLAVWCFHTAIPTVANRHYSVVSPCHAMPSRTAPWLAMPYRVVTMVTGKPAL